MKENTRYILNPDYILRHDKMRTLLTSRENLRGPKYYKESDEKSHFLIHPFYAMILSFFNG